MPVQDDERERELVRMFNLEWDPEHQRAGVDAILTLTDRELPCSLEVEVKSTTGSTVSTARDVGIDHIAKWRRKFFVVGFYSRDARRPELIRTICLSPVDMEPWISSIEEKILIDFQIAHLASSQLDLNDLYQVLGNKPHYPVSDAKKIHKRQWSSQQYEQAADLTVDNKRVISPQRMLDILRLRSRYVSERGATLNNPHVTKNFLDQFRGTDREILGANWAQAIRQIAGRFVDANPNHPAVLID